VLDIGKRFNGGSCPHTRVLIAFPHSREAK
jgi:hypothetical protein